MQILFKNSSIFSQGIQAKKIFLTQGYKSLKKQWVKTIFHIQREIYENRKKPDKWTYCCEFYVNIMKILSMWAK